MVIRTASHIHQLSLSVFRLLSVGHGLNAILLCHLQLHVVKVGEGFGKVGNTHYAVLHGCAVGLEKLQFG